MKQATQLPISLEEDAAQDSGIRFLSFDDAELRILASLRRAVRKALPSAILFLQTMLCVAFCFAMMFAAAIIGG